MTKLLALPLLLTGCLAAQNADEDVVDQQLRDVEHWNQLTDELDARRTEFLGKRVQELAAAGNALFWLDFTNFSPKLNRYDGIGGAKLAYTFSIGDGNTYNYRGSSALVVTAETGSDPVVYKAYDATTANRLIASTTLQKPPGAKYSAYAVDGSTVYFVDTPSDGPATLKRWTPGGALTNVTTLQSAGAEVGEFWDFGISGNTMVFIESGRIWSLDLVANKATWLMNKTEAAGHVDFRSDGVLFATADGPMYFDYATKTLADMKARIDANPFEINTTFASAAKFNEDIARWKHFMLYIGNQGLFAYDMKADQITPILLEPNRAELRVDYRYPVVLDNGQAFVTGLTSTSGATGADGPTYKLDLTPILK